MSQQDVETIRRVYDAWMAEDYDTVFDAYDEDIRLNPDQTPRGSESGDDYLGHAGVRRYMRAVYEAFEEYRPEIEELRDVGQGRVLTLAIEHGRGRGSGATVEARHTAHLWTSQPCLRNRGADRVELHD